jgi:hypothetical protein
MNEGGQMLTTVFFSLIYLIDLTEYYAKYVIFIVYLDVFRHNL